MARHGRAPTSRRDHAGATDLQHLGQGAPDAQRPKPQPTTSPDSVVPKMPIAQRGPVPECRRPLPVNCAYGMARGFTRGSEPNAVCATVGAEPQTSVRPRGRGLNAAHCGGSASNGGRRDDQRRIAMDIRPFHGDVPQEVLDELRRRIGATRWPRRDLADNRSQGVQLATIQELARYWATGYDWRTRGEAERAAVIPDRDRGGGHPFRPREVASRGRVAADHDPRLTVGPLTDPTVYDARAEDPFDLVLPSLPGSRQLTPTPGRHQGDTRGRCHSTRSNMGGCAPSK
jgi:Epoxide hydrolase N terminus